MPENIMPDTLIIVAHPDIEHSMVNRRWLKETRQHPDRFLVHELYLHYPDARVDAEAEQQLVDAHEKLVLQFPVYWFNCPPLMKQWLDQVLTYGWAYGSQGKALTDKTVALAVSLGTPAEDYRPGGRIGHDLAEVLRPFELTMKYCGANYRQPFTFHTIDSNAAYDEAAHAQMEQGVLDYRRWLENL